MIPRCLLSIYLPYTVSYAVYIGILTFYFVFIFFMFPETKRLSAEDASRVFDLDRKGRPLDKSVHVEDGHIKPNVDKDASESIEREDKE